MRSKSSCVAVTVLGLGLALVAGCRSRGPMPDGETLVVEGLEGDYPLSGRFEDGTPVTDVQFDSVLFRYDSYQIDELQTPKVEGVASYMQGERGVRLVVEGHCDERGSREYNMALGEHRGLAVRAYLINLGIDGERIQTRSYGEERPLEPGHSEAAWRRNRRGEFALYR